MLIILYWFLQWDSIASNVDIDISTIKQEIFVNVLGTN